MNNLWSSVVSTTGNLGLGFLSNKGKEIEGEYKTELAKLANDGTLTKAQFETELAKINSARATQLETLSNERNKSTLVTVAVIVLGLGILAAGVVLVLKKK